MIYTIRRTFSFYGTKQECTAELGQKQNFTIEDFSESKTDFESCSGFYEEEIELTKENYSLISSIRDWIKEQDDFDGECFSVEDNEGNTILTEEDL